MDYELFKKVVKENLTSFLQEPYKSYKVEIRSVEKVNRRVDGLQLVPPSQGELVAAPSLDMQALYEVYEETEDLTSLLKEIAEVFQTALSQVGKDIRFPDLNEMRENVIISVVNTQKNRALLDKIPHREFMDLSIIYRWVMPGAADDFYASIVTYGLLDAVGMTAETLDNIAWENTMRLFPLSCRCLMGSPLHLITNDFALHGAAGLLFTELLMQLAKQLNSDLYLIPSSIHEILAISVQHQSLKELRRQLRETNRKTVAEGEVLSNNIYYFCRETQKLSIA